MIEDIYRFIEEDINSEMIENIYKYLTLLCLKMFIGAKSHYRICTLVCLTSFLFEKTFSFLCLIWRWALLLSYLYS